MLSSLATNVCLCGGQAPVDFRRLYGHLPTLRGSIYEKNCDIEDIISFLDEIALTYAQYALSEQSNGDIAASQSSHMRKHPSIIFDNPAGSLRGPTHEWIIAGSHRVFWMRP